MKCNDILDQLDDFIAKKLDASVAQKISSHIEACGRCQMQLNEHKQYLEHMNSFKTPSLDSSHAARILRNSVEEGEKRINARKQKLSFIGGFVAASTLALSLALIMNLFSTPEKTPTFVGIYDWEQEISLVINVPKDMNGAKLILDLPADISIQGLEHLAIVEWPIDLKKGANTIVLPVNIEPYAEYAEKLSLAASIIYNNNKKDFELDINLDLPHNKARGSILNSQSTSYKHV